MGDGFANYTLRVRPELLKKLEYVASYEGRSKNKEIEQLIIRHIRAFEAEHGEIDISNP